MKTIEEILNETLAPEIKEEIKEAFDAKVEGIRSDMAARFEHDKAQIIEAMDKMIKDALIVQETAKIEEMAKLAEARVAYKNAINESKQLTRSAIKQLSESATTLVSAKLAEEVKSLRSDRAAIADRAEKLAESVEEAKAKLVENHKAHLANINEFVIKSVSRELNEFAEDKRALVETRVRLISESKARLADAQKSFIAESAKKVNDFVKSQLNSEIKQLHEDIERNRENAFGRRIFEAVAGEYMTSFLSEGSEVRELQKVLEAKEAEIASAAAKVEVAERKIMEAKDAAAEAERRFIIESERNERKAIMESLLSPLAGEKRAVMEHMLETMKTSQLEAQFNKFLPIVLKEGVKKTAPKKATLNENAAPVAPAIVDGGRADRFEAVEQPEANSAVQELVMLAGIRK